MIWGSGVMRNVPRRRTGGLPPSFRGLSGPFSTYGSVLDECRVEENWASAWPSGSSAASQTGSKLNAALASGRARRFVALRPRLERQGPLVSLAVPRWCLRAERLDGLEPAAFFR